MKSVLISIQPYYVFLIIARLMGWAIPQEKTVEVRKNFPKDKAWNKSAHIYCSKNRASFKRIPAQYQPFMKKLLGKVIGDFVCDEITTLNYDTEWGVEPPQEGYFFAETPSEYVLSDFYPCLTNKELINYGKRKPLYGWHISDLKIYDKPKGLGEFKAWRWECETTEKQFKHCRFGYAHKSHCEFCKWIRFPPLSWRYVEKGGGK